MLTVEKKRRQQHNPVMSTFSISEEKEEEDAAKNSFHALPGQLIGINSPSSPARKLDRVPREVNVSLLYDRVCWQQFRKLKRSRSLHDQRQELQENGRRQQLKSFSSLDWITIPGTISK